MKKICLFVALLLVLVLSSCTKKENIEETEVLNSNTLISATDTAQEPVYSYDGVAKLHDSFQKCSSFIDSEMTFCKSMWEISNYEDTKEVHDTFSYYVSKKDANKTISDSVSALTKASDAELSDCDPLIAPLLRSLLDKYVALAECLTNPSGAYKYYLNHYNTCYDEFVYAFDEMTAYLYAVGYYTD